MLFTLDISLAFDDATVLSEGVVNRSACLPLPIKLNSHICFCRSTWCLWMVCAAIRLLLVLPRRHQVRTRVLVRTWSWLLHEMATKTLPVKAIEQVTRRLFFERLRKSGHMGGLSFSFRILRFASFHIMCNY
jgi:hypothetical protein